MAENTIDNLSIQVVASADRAISTFNRLASGASGLRGAASGAAGGMQEMAQGARAAGAAAYEAGTQSGRARPNIKGVGKAAKDAGDKAMKGSNGLKTFWESLKRIAFYRLVRSVIKEITAAFSEGIKNLYHWSDLVNGHFAASMDRLATSSQYLKNSLGAMVSPLIETLVPVLDVIIDKIVDVLNFFNMLVSAVSGADTYTVAKKAAAVWEDSSKKTSGAAKRAADDIKRTILGFDEINKLVKPSSSSGGGGNSSANQQPNYAEMFEEKPLTGIFKKISDITEGWPDWLKALLGIGGTALAIFGIPALLKKIWDGLKNLFSFNIPDWFKWLFGPKGDGDGGLDIPKEIDLPDVDLPVDLTQGDWSVLDGLQNPIDKVVNVELNKGPWDKTAWLAVSMTPYNAARTITVNVKKGDWNNTAWLGANMTSYNATRTIIATVKKGKWNNTAWLAANMTKLSSTRTVNAEVKKGEWNNTAWTAANMTNYSPTRTVTAVVKKGGWDATAWKAANMTSYSPTRTITAVVKKGAWDATAWLAANLTSFSVTRTVTSVVQKGAWDSSAWTAANMTNYSPTRTVTAVVKKGGWDATAWKAANMTSYSPTRTVTAVVKKGEWNADAWKAANLTSGSINITVSVKLIQDGWTTVENYINDSFDGASGGGGQTSGGGAGRSRQYKVNVSLEKSDSTTIQSLLGLQNNAVSIVVDAVGAWANTIGGILPYLNVNDLSSFVWFDTVASWASTVGGVLSWLNVTNLSSDVSMDLTKDWGTKTPQSYLGLDNLSTTIKAKLKVDDKANKATIKISASNAGSLLELTQATKALGGIFSGGAWRNIPQYAGGTTNAGSLFLAGEDGPELVGHVGGRTEVLNKSQLASAMYAAVQSAMAPASANFAAAAQSMGYGSAENDYHAMYDVIFDAVSEAMAGDSGSRERTQLLRQINDKDFTAEISTASLNRAQNRMNRRAGTTLVPVG